MSAVQLDDLDRQLIEILGRDARVSNRKIAGDLGVTEGTVRGRIKRLQQELDEPEAGTLGVKGRGRDAYVSKDLAFAYASWVSTSFALSLIRGIERDLPLANLPTAKLSEIEPEFAAACRLAERFGLKGNQVLLSAARAVRLISGIDPTELLGMDGLGGCQKFCVRGIP